MALIPGFSSLHDVFDKLRRDKATLDDEVTSDALFNFVITGYSMIDWVKKDPSIPVSAKANSVVQALYNDRWLKVCGDLATAAKHFSLTSRIPITGSTTSKRGFGVGRYDAGGYGAGEESIEIKLNDGTIYNCLDLVKGVVSTWDTFFSTHEI
jgi:hypothetical protein